MTMLKPSLFAALVAMAPLPVQAQQMTITPGGSQQAMVGAPENFTGTAIIDPLTSDLADQRAGSSYVTFAPGARTVWHSHPAGQTLVVTTGSGWVQEWGGARQAIRPGDVIWTPPGVKHWHGATTATPMSHMALQHSVDGKNVAWLEPVTDDQYPQPTAD
jgi:quercetin dioxygenase-like cupin family protein